MISIYRSAMVLSAALVAIPATAATLVSAKVAVNTRNGEVTQNFEKIALTAPADIEVVSSFPSEGFSFASSRSRAILVSETIGSASVGNGIGSNFTGVASFEWIFVSDGDGTMSLTGDGFFSQLRISAMSDPTPLFSGSPSDVPSSLSLVSGERYTLFLEESAGFQTSNLNWSISYADPGPVNPIPEPATWALMIAGFGAVGFALRRRRMIFAN
jgi:hypothetical protein